MLKISKDGQILWNITVNISLFIWGTLSIMYFTGTSILTSSYSINVLLYYFWICIILIILILYENIFAVGRIRPSSRIFKNTLFYLVGIFSNNDWIREYTGLFPIRNQLIDLHSTEWLLYDGKWSVYSRIQSICENILTR